MNKVITINLNGRAYQLEEEGYAALGKYLDAARAALAGDPGMDEIVADLEQAIADKCDALLTPHKNVVTAAEIDAIIEAMGPVESGAEREAKEAGADERPKAAKRLYRIMEGRWLSGLANGVGAYFDLDPMIVRGIFVLLTIVTGGAWAVPYIVFSFIVPVARTEQELAEAHGEAPLTARDFVERVRAEGERFAERHRHDRREWREWRRTMRDQRRAWRDEWRAETWEWRCGNDARCPRSVGFAEAFGGIAIAALTVLWIVAVWSFLTTGLVLGLAIGAGYPLWLTLLFVTLVYLALVSPFKAMTCRRFSHHHHHGGFLSTLIFLIVLFYVASLLVPAVHGWWNAAVAYLQTIR